MQVVLELDDGLYDAISWANNGNVEGYCTKIITQRASRLYLEYSEYMKITELEEKAKFADLVMTAPQEDIDILLTKTKKQEGQDV